MRVVDNFKKEVQATITTKLLLKGFQMSFKMGFANAMRADMTKNEMSEAAVGRALGGISQQAVHKWLERGFPPLSRVNDLRILLGDNGEFAKLDHDDLFGDGKTSRTPNPHANTPDSTPPEPRLSIQSRADRVREFARAQDAAFKAHLPPALRKNLGRKLSAEDATPVFMDYASDKLVLELTYSQEFMLSQNSAAAILRLMLYRDTSVTKPNAVFALVCAEGEKSFPKLAKLASITYGVDLMNFESAAQAAEFAARVEGEDAPELSGPDDE